MKLSQTSISFANKILKHHPKEKHLSTQKTCCQHQQKSKQKYVNGHPQNTNSLLGLGSNGNKTKVEKDLQIQIKPYLHAHDHRKERQIYEKSTQEKLANMRKFKEEGNDHYKNQRFREAAYHYQKVIVYSDYTFPQKEDDEQELGKLIQQSNCNLGMSLIKMNQFDKSESFLTQAKRGKQKKLKNKATYWLCKLFIRKGQFSNAQNQLKELKIINQNAQNNVQIQQLETLLKKQRDIRSHQDKVLYQNMFKAQAKTTKT